MSEASCVHKTSTCMCDVYIIHICTYTYLAYESIIGERRGARTRQIHTCMMYIWCKFCTDIYPYTYSTWKSIIIERQGACTRQTHICMMYMMYIRYIRIFIHIFDIQEYNMWEAWCLHKTNSYMFDVYSAYIHIHTHIWHTREWYVRGGVLVQGKCIHVCCIYDVYSAHICIHTHM